MKTKLGSFVKSNVETYTKQDNWEYVNYLDTGNLTEDAIENFMYIDLEKESLPSRAKRKIKKDDILFSTVRPNQRHFGIVKTVPKNTLVSTGFSVIEVDKSIANPYYIYYWLTQSNVINFLQSIAEQTVSAYPSIKSSDIENLDIDLPPLAIQNKVAKILQSLSQKIEINNQINKNLLAYR